MNLQKLLHNTRAEIIKLEMELEDLREKDPTNIKRIEELQVKLKELKDK